jgi:signal transduction histidine kinase
MYALLASTISSVNLERHYIRKDGTEFWGRLSCERFHDAQGNELGIIGVITDITERKQAEMELEKYHNQLEKLVEQRSKELSLLNDQLRQSQKLEAVGILAGGIAHEFSNILATMKGSMYLIHKKLPEGSPVMKYAQQVLASINKANILSKDLLTFSRKQKISLRPLHFNEIIGNVGKMLIHLIGEDIEFAMMLSEKNPTVMADMNQIEQVLVNLATNARDAMPNGGRLTIGTAVMKMDEDFKKQHGYGVPGEYVVLIISDSGTGIEEAIRGKIFEPFFTTKAVGKGSGLGLAVTYGIVKKHNGFIDVESVIGEGTTFKIYFPTVAAEVIQPIGRDRGPAKGGAETILLAEDDEDARATMSEMVGMSGYTLLEARDGEEAIRVFAENKDRIQLVLLDVRMPKKNGRVVYEEIKRTRPQTKFLFISGYTADIMDSLCVSEGGINFISKTVSPDEILRKIRQVLDQ